VMQPAKFELFINLKISMALGLTLPPTSFVRAEDVVVNGRDGSKADKPQPG
jgi:hypothetical protein